MANEEKIIRAITSGRVRISKAFQIATLASILQRQDLYGRPEVLEEIFADGKTDPLPPTLPAAVNAFETWFLGCVAQAVHAGEVPASLLMKLQAEFAEARATPQEADRAMAVREIADIAGIDLRTAAETLAAMEARPAVARDKLMRRLAEAWLEGQRQASRRSRG